MAETKPSDEPQQELRATGMNASPRVGHELPFVAPSTYLLRPKSKSISLPTPMSPVDEEQLQGLVSRDSLDSPSCHLTRTPHRLSELLLLKPDRAGRATDVLWYRTVGHGLIIRISLEWPARLPSNTNKLRRPPAVVPPDRPRQRPVDQKELEYIDSKWYATCDLRGVCNDPAVLF
jgi:hypothetical protein